MTWNQVARKDFEDAVRSRMLWSIMGVLVVFVGFLLLVATQLTESGGDDTLEALAFVATFSKLFIPLVALVAGYMAVVGERRSGSLRLLLGYPHSRRDVIAGKLVGRAGVIVLTFLAGFGAMVGLVTALFGAPDPVTFLSLVGVATLFALAFTGLAVGISASVAGRGRAMALAIGFFLACLVFWDGLAAGAHYAVYGALPGLEADAWYFLLRRLNPITAYNALAEAALGTDVGRIVRLPVEDLPEGTAADSLELADRVDGPLPFYLGDRFAAFTLVLWGTVPAALGYLRFRRSDL